MWTYPMPLFRCHRCGEWVRVVEAGRRSEHEPIRPARYSCGHLDRMADLKVVRG